VQAAHENRTIKDLVSEGLRLVLGLTRKNTPRQLRRMTKPPVTIRKGNVIPILSNDAMAAQYPYHQRSPGKQARTTDL
jgi:hypothetical protein